jgi:hypothetical protein
LVHWRTGAPAHRRTGAPAHWRIPGNSIVRKFLTKIFGGQIVNNGFPFLTMAVFD